jgi:hypothetical protein
MSQAAAEPPAAVDEAPGGAAPEPPAPQPPQPPHVLTKRQRTERWFEVVTAVMLGVIAVATAWSGYQSARWSGEQSRAPPARPGHPRWDIACSTALTIPTTRTAARA